MPIAIPNSMMGVIDKCWLLAAGCELLATAPFQNLRKMIAAANGPRIELSVADVQKKDLLRALREQKKR